MITLATKEEEESKLDLEPNAVAPVCKIRMNFSRWAMRSREKSYALGRASKPSHCVSCYGKVTGNKIELLCCSVCGDFWHKNCAKCKEVESEIWVCSFCLVARSQYQHSEEGVRTPAPPALLAEGEEEECKRREGQALSVDSQRGNFRFDEEGGGEGHADGENENHFNFLFSGPKLKTHIAKTDDFFDLPESKDNNQIDVETGEDNQTDVAEKLWSSPGTILYHQKCVLCQLMFKGRERLGPLCSKCDEEAQDVGPDRFFGCSFQNEEGQRFNARAEEFEKHNSERRFRLARIGEEELVVFERGELAKALYSQKLRFCDKPNYTREFKNFTQANDPAYSSQRLEKLSQEDVVLMELLQTVTRCGVYPSCRLQWQNNRYAAIAAETIPANTLICQHGGDVTTLRAMIDERLPEGITLLPSPSSFLHLLLCFAEHGNLARYIWEASVDQRATVACGLFQCRGRCTVLFWTTREVSKGEVLLYSAQSSEIVLFA
jgi:hypothetical protein